MAVVRQFATPACWRGDGSLRRWASVASLISPHYLTRGTQKTRDNIHYQAENAVFTRQNRIEKEKLPLTEELKETLEKQIERFNPQEPLFLLIDYFRVRFPTTDALKIIRDVLQLKADYMLYEDYG